MIYKVEFTHNEITGRLYSIRVFKSDFPWPLKISSATLERWLLLYFKLEYEVLEQSSPSEMEKECSFLNYVTEIEFRHAEMDFS